MVWKWHAVSVMNEGMNFEKYRLRIQSRGLRAEVDVPRK